MLGKILSGKYVRDTLLTVDNGSNGRTRSAEVRSIRREEIRAGELAGIQISNFCIREMSTGAILAINTFLSSSTWAEATLVIVIFITSSPNILIDKYERKIWNFDWIFGTFYFPFSQSIVQNIIYNIQV